MSDSERSIKSRTNKSSPDSGKSLTMRQVLSVSKPRSIPTYKQWKQIHTILTSGERLTISIFSALAILSIFTLGLIYVLSHRTEVPALGGEYTEALIGEPQFINPLYAQTSDVDADLTGLVYSGLLKLVPGQGLVPDMAQTFEVNEQETVYTLRLREDAMFHNDEPVRSKDVLFTISAIQNPAYRSPLLPRFKDVSVVQVDDLTVSFHLETPSATFSQALTVGILPSTLWAEILPQNAPLAALNLQPVGSGPYKFSEFVKDKRGGVRSYTLEPFQDTYATVPSIERLTFKFYQDAEMAMDALSNKHVEGVGIVPLSKARSIEENKQMTLLPLDLPQEVVLFFNQQTVDGFSKQEVREAIAASINRDALVDLLNGWAVPIHGPLLPGMIGFDETARATYDVAMVQKTIATLKDNISETSDQKKTDQQKEDETTENENETSDEQNPGELSLTTVDSEEYVAVAQALKIQLEEAGFKIELNAVPQSLFLKEVIEPRNFELLLAPVLLGQDPDPYVFWHSSQIGPNGLNLALYQNKDVDVLLEKARETTSTKERGDLYRQFAEHLLKDTPAVFLYQSKYLYALPKKIQGVTLTRINTPKDRFLDLPNWYIKTKKTLR